MNKGAIFPVSILMSFAAFGVVTAFYLCPALSAMSTVDALTALIVIHTYRFIGLSFLLPGVVADGLSPEFARPAAYGDLIAAVLAVLAAIMLHGHLPGAVTLAWVFNVWGAADLLYAMFRGVRHIRVDPKGPGLLGGAFFIPTVVVPALLITHGLMFWLLLRGTP